VEHYQVITSSSTGDEKGGGKLPDWDKTKNVYKALTTALKRTPRRGDKLLSLLGPKKFREIQDSVGVDRNNANKYLAAACLGSRFMVLYDQANEMHMDCESMDCD
jgi:hypothetical protein